MARPSEPQEPRHKAANAAVFDGSAGWKGKAGYERYRRPCARSHTAYRDPRSADLSAEELDQLDLLTRKLARKEHLRRMVLPPIEARAPALPLFERP